MGKDCYSEGEHSFFEALERRCPPGVNLMPEEVSTFYQDRKSWRDKVALV